MIISKLRQLRAKKSTKPVPSIAIINQQINLLRYKPKTMKFLPSIILVIVSQLTLFSQIDHWETVVYNTDNWQYFVGNSEPPSDWMMPNFNDNSWKTGKGGIGYGDGDDNTIIEPTYALYIRNTFTTTDLSAIESVILQADYDDAFVAYLNGVEIARANIDDAPPKFDRETITDHEATLYTDSIVESTFLPQSAIEDLLSEGENVLAVSIHNRYGPSSSDMTANFFLTLGINNTSTNYRPTPNWFITPIFSSELPIIKITTKERVNRNEAIIGEIGVIHQSASRNTLFDEPNEYQGQVSIKFRGQSSLSFPKKNYSIEFKDSELNDLDTAFLGFPKEEDFILHGPFSDKSLMRNVLVMHLANKMGQYASRTKYVDLFVNGDYQGIYVLMEKIKRDKDRVDVAKLRESDIEGDELTGGYIFKIDKGEPDWESSYNFYQSSTKLKYQLVYPDIDKVQPEQFAYIRSYIDSFERAMFDPNLIFGGKPFNKYMNLTSFAETHLLNELSRNVDGYRLSSYFHKRKDSNGGKFYSGPAWDFNLAFRNADYCDGANTEDIIFYGLCHGGYPFWWDVLLQNEQFQSIAQCRWQELRASAWHTDSIFAFIDEQVATINPSIEQNFARWDILGRYIWPNPAPLSNTYLEEIDKLKDWLNARLLWMDNHFAGECQLITNTTNIQPSISISIAPNPASDYLSISFDESLATAIDGVWAINSLGQRIPLSTSKNNRFTYPIQHLKTGIYFIEVQIGGKHYLQKMIISR